MRPLFSARPTRRSLYGALALGLLLSCAPPDDGPPEPDALGLATLSDAVPETPAGERFAWLLASINGDATLRPDEMPYIFSPMALDTISADEFVAQLEGFRASAPWVLVGYVDTPTPYQLSAVVREGAAYRRVDVHVQEGREHRIDAAFVTPFGAR